MNENMLTNKRAKMFCSKARVETPGLFTYLMNFVYNFFYAYEFFHMLKKHCRNTNKIPNLTLIVICIIPKPCDLLPSVQQTLDV